MNLALENERRKMPRISFCHLTPKQHEARVLGKTQDVQKVSYDSLPLVICIINGQFLKTIYDAWVENRPFVGHWFLDILQND